MDHGGRERFETARHSNPFARLKAYLRQLAAWPVPFNSSQPNERNKPVNIQVYLFFEGQCEEAITFYQEVLGAELEMLMRFNESPEPLPPDAIPPGHEDKVMHCSFRVGETTVMASDGCGTGDDKFGGFSLSLNAANPAEADRLFNALADGGTITMPIDKTFWSPRFGMLTDRFGVPWMVNAINDA